MRKISAKKIEKVVATLCVKANIELRADIKWAMQNALTRESRKRAKHILKILIENADIARSEKRPLCQDTGMVSVYLEIGQGISVTGGSLKGAVEKGVKDAYRRNFFRKSVVKSPLKRTNTRTNTPVVIHAELTNGRRFKITVVPKGFGSENKSALTMLKPTDGENEITNFVVDTVKKAGPDACPPYVLGVGIGGTFDSVSYLAKKALTIPIDKSNPRKHLKILENKILERVNNLGIGPMGLGGKTTCLGVNVMEFPTHIAGLPVAVNIGCHVTRSARAVI